MKNVKFEILENGKLIEEYVLTMPAEDIEAAHAEASKVWAEYHRYALSSKAARKNARGRNCEHA